MVSSATGVAKHKDVDRKAKAWYYVPMINITNIIKQKYYTYQPGEFLPVYSGGELINRAEFHKYRLTWIVKHHRAAFYQFTHYAG